MHGRVTTTLHCAVDFSQLRLLALAATQFLEGKLINKNLLAGVRFTMNLSLAQQGRFAPARATISGNGDDGLGGELDGDNDDADADDDKNHAALCTATKVYHNKAQPSPRYSRPNPVAFTINDHDDHYSNSDKSNKELPKKKHRDLRLGLVDLYCTELYHTVPYNVP